MKYFGTIRNGVVVFDQPVDFPDGARVEVIIVNVETTGNDLMQLDQNLDAIYEVMDRRFSSGFTDTAARHNEHQP
jgi:predicted DNA-binding antitoxin AbrB/MazE fold protein